MKYQAFILFISLALFTSATVLAQRHIHSVRVDCFGEIMDYRFNEPVVVDTGNPYNQDLIESYSNKLVSENAFGGLIYELDAFRKKHRLDDWLYYQLVRRVADQLSPKAENYTRYTIYKWYLLSLSGYESILTYAEGRILFYVLSDENIYNIPVRKENGKNYVCLNYHDYGSIDFTRFHFKKIDISVPDASRSFSYQVKSLPELTASSREKEINFNYNNSEYTFRIKLNPSIGTYFKNYPTTDYEKHFNIPLSGETYNSLMPALKKYLKGLHAKDGVDFLMHFTRYSFLFKPDSETYGSEKINSPEMTLLSESSDCEDRVSLFYYLVKEIYDLPMIVVVYPKHVTIAVHFDKSFGNTISYNGRKFTICEPTPQKEDLKIGESNPDLAKQPFKVAFAYEPSVKPHK